MRLLFLVLWLVAPAAFASVGELTRDARLHVRLLDQQIDWLDQSKRSLVGPVTTLAFGGSAFVAGAVIFSVAMVQRSFIFVVGIVVAGIALVPIMVGVVWFAATVGYNHRLEAAIEKLTGERDALRPVSLLPSSEPKLFELASF